MLLCMELAQTLSYPGGTCTGLGNCIDYVMTMEKWHFISMARVSLFHEFPEIVRSSDFRISHGPESNQIVDCGHIAIDIFDRMAKALVELGHCPAMDVCVKAVKSFTEPQLALMADVLGIGYDSVNFSKFDD